MSSGYDILIVEEIQNWNLQLRMNTIYFEDGSYIFENIGVSQILSYYNPLFFRIIFTFKMHRLYQGVFESFSGLCSGSYDLD